MKFLNPKINVPWIGSEVDAETGEERSTRQWSALRFTGIVDRRRVKREVRKAMRRILERKVDTDEILMVCKTGRIVHEGKMRREGNDWYKLHDQYRQAHGPTGTPRKETPAIKAGRLVSSMQEPTELNASGS